MAERHIYADNAATAPLCKAALDEMIKYLTFDWSNPSSVYASARESHMAMDEARAVVASCIGAQPNEIFFTSGGTEADNWAVKGSAIQFRNKGRHMITSSIEHHAITESMDFLKQFGFEITELPVDKYGMVSPADLEAAIRPDTILISIMAANNEIGTIQPIKELGAIAKEHGIPFHTDAVQAAGHMPIDVKEMNIDMMSMAAHKFGGPKGVGALYIRRGLRIPPLLHGGGHESGRRSGTENVVGIRAMAAALKYSVDNLPQHSAHLIKMRDRLIEGLLKIPCTQLTGHPTQRLPGTVSIVINYIEGESIILMLDSFGISASSGSACTSGSLDPSHVLLAIGLEHEVAHGSLRLSISADITEEDVDYIIEKVTETAKVLRSMSPVWKPEYANN